MAFRPYFTVLEWSGASSSDCFCALRTSIDRHLMDRIGGLLLYEVCLSRHKISKSHGTLNLLRPGQGAFCEPSPFRLDQYMYLSLLPASWI